MMESYLLKSSLSLLILYVLFHWIYRKESNHQLKRLIGLGCLIFSSCLLHIPMDGLKVAKDYPSVIQTILEGSSFVQQSISYVDIPDSTINWYLTTYFIVILLLSIRSLAGLSTLFSLYFKSEKSKRWGFIVVETTRSISPFTFFHILFISKQDLVGDKLDALVRHEQLHRDQLHSIDTLLLEFLSILFWFNPAIWLFRRDIKAEHEYLADEHVLKNGFSKLDYQHLLFQTRTGTSIWSVSHLSYSTSLKKRFIMMEKRKINTRSSYIRAAVFLPMIAFIVFLVSFSPLTVSGQTAEGAPVFKLYHGQEKVDLNRELDLEKGILPTTERLFARALDANGLKFRVSLLHVTYFSKGLGIGTMRAGEKFSMRNMFKNVDVIDGDAIMVEIKEYQTRNAEGTVNTIKLEHPVYFNFPVIVD